MLKLTLKNLAANRVRFAMTTFAVVLAVTRKTGSAEISSFGGLMGYSPVLGMMLTLFLASLTGSP